jgi:hypothetical protein
MFNFNQVSTQNFNRRFSLKTFAFAFLLFSTFALLPADASAQTERTITKKVAFAKGKTSTIIRGTAQAYTYYAFAVSARKNQFIVIDLNSPNENVYLTVFEPGGLEPMNASPEEDVSSFSGDLTKTGTYKIMVYAKSDAGASPFTMRISIK